MYLCPLSLTQIIVCCRYQEIFIQWRNDYFIFFQFTENSCWAEFGGYQTAALGSQKQPGQGHGHPGNSGTDLTPSDCDVWVVTCLDGMVVAQGPCVRGFLSKGVLFRSYLSRVGLFIFFILAISPSFFYTKLSSCLLFPFIPIPLPPIGNHSNVVNRDPSIVGLS